MAAWAVVVTSSEGLADELLAELRTRVDEVEEVELSGGIRAKSSKSGLRVHLINLLESQCSAA